MPMGKGTYGSQKGRPSNDQKLSGKQKNLPEALKKRLWLPKKEDEEWQ